MFTISILFSLLISMSSNTNISDENELWLQELDKKITERPLFMRGKETRIDSLQNMLSDKLNDIDRYNINNKIYDEYSTYRFDSAMLYVEKNLQIANRIGVRKYLDECTLNRSMLLSTSGLYQESFANLNKIDRAKLDSSLLFKYYIVSDWAMNIAKEFIHDDYYSIKYLNKQILYADSICSLLIDHNDQFYYYNGRRLHRNNELEEAKQYYFKGLEMMKVNTRVYAMTAFGLAEIFRIQKNDEFYLKYLVLAAISDQVCPLKENLASQNLSMYLYQKQGKKDLERAYNYIQCAMEDAQFYNNRLRMIQISQLLPTIVKAYNERSQSENKYLKISLLIISILTILTIFAFVYISKQIRMLRKSEVKLNEFNSTLINLNQELELSNSKLCEANRTREDYVGLFVDLCSNYIDKLDNFRDVVKRKIVARQFEELYNLTNSKEYINEELSDFFKAFDTTFLQLFPSFISDFNTLLLENQKVYPKKNELLNTELRIFALIRLGIVDSMKISAFLRYSLQTIYNYRTKTRNKSIGDRELFESRVAQIGSTFWKNSNRS